MRRKVYASVISAMLVFAGSASAGEVMFSGDARIRYILKDNYHFGNEANDTTDKWDSRVRVNYLGKLESGAYAKARLRFDVNTWDNGNQKRLWGDIAYMSVPMGPATVKGGMMKSNLTKFTEWDQSTTQLTAGWDMLGATWTGLFRMIEEGTISENDIDRQNDNDVSSYGLIIDKKFGESVSSKLIAIYQNDERDQMSTGEYQPSASGFNGALYVQGDHGPFGWEAEASFKENQTMQSRDDEGYISNATTLAAGDDGWGWYVRAKYDFDNVVPILNVGMTMNGFEADNDFGWIMLGNSNNEPTTVVSTLGQNGDWFWVAPSVQWAATEKLNITGNFVWASIDSVDEKSEDTLYYDNLYELSADLTYTLAEKTTLSWKVGAVKPEIAAAYKGDANPSEDLAFGTYLRLQIGF